MRPEKFVQILPLLLQVQASSEPAGRSDGHGEGRPPQGRHVAAGARLRDEGGGAPQAAVQEAQHFPGMHYIVKFVH